MLPSLLVIRLAFRICGYNWYSASRVSTLYPNTAAPKRRVTKRPASLNSAPYIPVPVPGITKNNMPKTTGNIVIVTIHYDGTGSNEPDEYVEIRNDDILAIQLENWTLRDEANHVFTFPNSVIIPTYSCRIYTNEDHPDWCGFNYGSGSAIWNNTGDTATLRDGNGTLIGEYSYQDLWSVKC